MDSRNIAVPFSLWEYPRMTTRSTGAEFYERLLEALKDAELPTTQTSIADFLDIHQSAVAKWKSSESFPTYENARRLAQRASVSLTWLWLGIGNKKNGGSMDDQTVQLLDAWHQMPEVARAELLEYIRFRAAHERDRSRDTDPTPDSTH